MRTEERTVWMGGAGVDLDPRYSVTPWQAPDGVLTTGLSQYTVFFGASHCVDTGTWCYSYAELKPLLSQSSPLLWLLSTTAPLHN